MLAKLSERQFLYQFPEPFRYLVPVSWYRSLAEAQKKIMFPNTYRLPGRGKSIAPEYVALDRSSASRWSCMTR
jgi:hypothetical protein